MANEETRKDKEVESEVPELDDNVLEDVSGGIPEESGNNNINNPA